MDSRLLDLNVLYDSWKKCQKGVSWKSSVQKYEMHCLERINDLRKQLVNGKYEQRPFYEFDLMERGKPRHIKSLHINDRVFQRALCDDVIIPTMGKYLIYDNSASIKGKGVDFARKRLKQHLTDYYRHYGREGYVLQIDFAKYFDSMEHDRVIEIFSRFIKDPAVMKIIEYIVRLSEKGMGIGAQISQMAGIVYPMDIDNYCKIVKSCKYYARYMDDIYILHHDKAFLTDLLDGIRKYCIPLNEKKTVIRLLKHGFTFLQMKYRLSPTGHISVVPVSKSFTRQRRKMKKLVNKLPREEFTDQYKCWRGNIAKYDCHRSLKSMDRLFSDLLNLHYSDNIEA